MHIERRSYVMTLKFADPFGVKRGQAFVPHVLYKWCAFTKTCWIRVS